MLSRDQFALVGLSQFNLFAHYANSVYWRAISAPDDALVTPHRLAHDIENGVAELMGGITPLMDMQTFELADGDEGVLMAMIADVETAHAGMQTVLTSVTDQVIKGWRSQKLRETTAGIPTLGLRHHDAIGRSYAAGESFRLVLRDFAVNTYVTERLVRLKAEGYSRVRLDYPKPDHERQGMVLDIDQAPVWRHLYFHPNSEAKVVAHD
jgi:hypothetical protein